MVSIQKKVVSGQTYYYLEHSFRKGGKVEKKELYLGKHIPKNIDELKRQFVFEIYKEKWFKSFDEIKTAFAKERKSLPKVVAEKEMSSFVVKFTYDTNRIEGSSLTFRETANLLENGVSPSKPRSDIKEAEAHRDVFYEMLRYDKDLSLRIALEWHYKLFNGTKPEIAGKLRHYQVGISGTEFLPPSPVEVEPLMRDFFKWLDKNKKKLHPVELAALIHLKFVSIHPFGDGNGRISRLIMNFALKQNRFPMLDIKYTNRNSYYNALERAQVKKNDLTFLNWFFRTYSKEFKRYAKRV
ncbi:MAG: Fic family protein [Candidatus Micrarchaeota archaeon]|nr:Fic family protein [Candidatus Micrarchaeota archaeon]